MSTPVRRVLADVVEEHLDEAAFLASQWERALASRLTLDEVGRGPEARLFAHLDGLAVAEAAVVRGLLASAPPDAGRAFAASLVAIDAGPEGMALVLSLLRGQPGPGRRGAARALALCSRPGLARELEALLAGGEPVLQAAALDALSLRGQAPQAPLRAHLASPEADVRAAALRAARLAGPELRVAVAPALDAPEPAVRDAAIEAGLVLGLADAHRAARRAVEGGAPELRLPLLALAVSGEPADLERIEAALSVPEVRPDALRALAASGWPRAADLALPFLEDGATARLAAEVVSCVGGLEIAGPYALPEPSAPEEPIPFADEDLDADVVPGEDAELPLPDAFGVAGWWTRERARLDASVRHRSGRPLDPDAMLDGLRRGVMRRRPSLALEVAIRSRGTFQLEPRTWAREQRRFLAERQLAVGSGFGAPFGRFLQR